MENQKALLASVGLKLGATESDLTPWYKVTQSGAIKMGCATILNGVYKGSVYAMLKTVYPDYPWLPWKFELTPREVGREKKLPSALSGL
jgi:hypothetical protein